MGIDFEGTAFAFLESPIFLMALVVAMAASIALARARARRPAAPDALSGIGIGLGALLGAGSLDDRFSVWWPGLLAGGLCALLASAATLALIARVRTRLDADARGALPVYEEGSGLVLAAACILVPPIAILAIGFFLAPHRIAQARSGEVRRACAILRESPKAASSPSSTARSRRWSSVRSPRARPRRWRRSRPRAAACHDCTAAFPSVTPVCAATIATGVRQDRHHIPAMNWWSRAERRYIEYGSSFAAARRFGINRQLVDTVYNMNAEHLAADARTVFEALDDARTCARRGRPTSCTAGSTRTSPRASSR